MPSHIQGREVLSLQLNCKPSITDCMLTSPQIHKLKLIPSVTCMKIVRLGGHQVTRAGHLCLISRGTRVLASSDVCGHSMKTVVPRMRAPTRN